MPKKQKQNSSKLIEYGVGYCEQADAKIIDETSRMDGLYKTVVAAAKLAMVLWHPNRPKPRRNTCKAKTCRFVARSLSGQLNFNSESGNHK